LQKDGKMARVADVARSLTVMVVLGTTIHEFASGGKLQAKNPLSR
jgi:hypothetical protein